MLRGNNLHHSAGGTQGGGARMPGKEEAGSLLTANAHTHARPPAGTEKDCPQLCLVRVTLSCFRPSLHPAPRSPSFVIQCPC